MFLQFCVNSTFDHEYQTSKRKIFSHRFRVKNKKVNKIAIKSFYIIWLSQSTVDSAIHV